MTTQIADLPSRAQKRYSISKDSLKILNEKSYLVHKAELTLFPDYIENRTPTEIDSILIPYQTVSSVKGKVLFYRCAINEDALIDIFPSDFHKYCEIIGNTKNNILLLSRNSRRTAKEKKKAT